MAKNIKVTLELDNKQFNRAISQSERQVQGFSTNSKSAISGIGTALAAIGAGTVIKSIVDVGASFQQLQNSLNVVFGSVEEGAAAFDRVQDIASGTQFSVQQLTQAFVQLKGAGVEPTEELLLTFADTASVTTDQMGTFQAALDLVSRSTAGGLGLEDLNRLADKGIPVFRILEERLGLARLEISEFGKTTEGANTVVRALLAGLQEDFGGALAGQVGLINFELSQLGDAFDNLQNQIFQAFGDTAGESIRALTDGINKLANNSELLSSALNGLGATLEIIAGAFVIFRLGTKDALAGFVVFADRIKKFFAGGLIVTLIKRFKDLGFALTLLRGGFSALTVSGFITALGAAGFAAAPVIAIITGLTFALDGLIRLFTDTSLFSIFGDVVNMFKLLFDAINPFKKEVEQVVETLEEETEAVVENVEATREAARQKELAKIAEEAYEKGLRSTTKALKEQTSAFDKNDPLFQYQMLLRDIFEEASNNINTQLELERALRNVTKLLDLDPTNVYFAEALRIIKERLEGTNQALEDFDEVVDRIAKTTDNYNMLLERLVELQTAGKITAEEFKKAKEELDEAFTDNEALNSFLETLGRAQVRLSEDLADAFLEGKDAMDSFKNFFKTMVKQIIADIIRLSIIQPILSSILNPFGFGFGTGGSIIKLAGGGRIMANQPAIVGEEGPELFMPSTAGTVIPNGEFGMSAPSQRVTYNINAVDTQSFQQALARDPEFLFAVTQQGARSLPRS